MVERLIVLALLVVLAGGCTDALPGPHVQLVPVDGTRSAHLEGARAWEAIGLAVSYDSAELVECRRHWHDVDGTACQWTIGVIVAGDVRERFGSLAAADREARAIYLDDELEAQGRTAVRIAVAHELGHVVLDTSRHTAGGVMGGASWRLELVDLELACELVGRGCE